MATNHHEKIDNSETGIRSNQNLSFNWLGSADFGVCVPFHVQELIPTDKVVTCKPTIELQMLALASPTFGKLDLYCHYFFVPTRLLWNSAPDFFSQTGSGKNATPPYWTKTDFRNMYMLGDDGDPTSGGTLDRNTRPLFKHWTSMGLPPFFAGTHQMLNGSDKLSVLPFRAYNQIWWDFYRDPELLPDDNKDQYIITSSGHQAATEFTDNKFWPMRRSIKDTWIAELFRTNGVTPYGLSLDMYAVNNSSSPGSYRAVKTGDPDINTSSALTSQRLRVVEALTRLSERLSLSGKRQIDMLFSQYGVKPEYNKLQMCQYIGGAKSTVLVSDITSSADTSGMISVTHPESYNTGAPLGFKGGCGYSMFNELNVEYTATEHGYLIGIFSVMPHVHFVQGLGKEWYRNELNDWFRKELEHTGQIAVPKQEVGIKYGLNDQASTIDYDQSKDKETFAFTQPYYDYKRKMDVLAGDFMWYHQISTSDLSSNDQLELQYMQSMGIYLDYPVSRTYTPENMLVDGAECNKIFAYLGGSVWDDVDDHFHVNCDVDCVINRPMDGYAIPTVETTENPHLSTSPIGSSVTL